MKKETVYIVLLHKLVLKTPGKKGIKPVWDISEKVEFVSQLRTRHHTESSAIADYTNRKLLTGSRLKMTSFDQFDEYVRKKYEKEMNELDRAYGNLQVTEPIVVNDTEVFADEFGNVRARTIFDKPVTS